jgi:hypothetical protein
MQNISSAERNIIRSQLLFIMCRYRVGPEDLPGIVRFDKKVKLVWERLLYEQENS